MKRLVIMAATVALVSAAAPSGAVKTERTDQDKRSCNTINLGQPRIFYKQNMRCASAKHYARRLYKTEGRDEPRNFSCTSGSNFNDGGACQHDFKSKYFGWHPADKRRPAGGKIKVLCWNKNFPNDGPPQIRSTPRRCALFADGVDFNAGAVYLRKLRWEHWGARKTRSKAEYHEPMNLEDPWIGIGVQLSKPVERCGRTVYSKAAFRFHGQPTTDFKLWTC